MTKKFNYVYRIMNILTNKVYIGCHSTNNLDDGYMGSGKYIKRAIEKYGIDNFKKEILSYHPDQESMFNAEAAIVTREFIGQPNNYNLAEGGKGGYKGQECYTNIRRSMKISQSQKNRIMARDLSGNIIKISKDDVRFQTKELVGLTKGLATVKDGNGLILKVAVDDPRINSGELVGHTKGLAVMKDKDGIRHVVPVDDPRIKSGDLVGNTKGNRQTIESNIKRSLALKGKPKPQRHVTCPYCGKSTTKTNIKRWHQKCSNTIDL